MKKIWLIITGIIIIAALLFLLIDFGEDVTFENEKTIKVKIADSEKEIEQGLMNVKRLGKNDGMLFVFDDEKVRHFWMKNTLIPLDIIFLNKEKNIVSIQTMKPCKKDP